MRIFLPPVIYVLVGLPTMSAWTPTTLPFRMMQQKRQRQLQQRRRRPRRLLSTNATPSPFAPTGRCTTVVVLTATTATTEETATVHEEEEPPLVLYNSLTRSKETFYPVQLLQQQQKDDDQRQPQPQQRSEIPIAMYTCGPTVYDAAHIGNFRAFLTYDLVKRVLLYLGYTSVVHICNITDVDDKILVRADREQVQQITDLTRHWERVFQQDLAALHCIPATVYPRATDHIPVMLRFVQDLAGQGLAYPTADGSWYFDTQAQEGKYGQQLVPQMKLEDMVEQKATENAEGKKHVADFCVWKAFKEGVDRMDAAWESAMYVGQEEEEQKAAMVDQPWPLPEPVIDLGRPGWHLECSAMARTYFGDTTLDFHGGGIDLKFPHHENEIAQSEGWSNTKYCNCWFHNGFVNMGDEKMSKSLGNFLTLADVCPTALDVRAYRYVIISSQYRNALNFSKKALKDAKKLIRRLDTVMAYLDSVDASAQTEENHNTSVLAHSIVPKAMESFETAIRDDLSMPRAAATLIAVIKAVEQESKRSGEDDLDIAGLLAAQTAIQKMDTVFGILYEVPHRDAEAASGNDGAGNSTAVPSNVMELVGQRSQAKEAKDWDLADSLRQRITELGFSVKDVKDGDPIVTPVDA